jgi:hypothetical protein
VAAIIAYQRGGKATNARLRGYGITCGGGIFSQKVLAAYTPTKGRPLSRRLPSRA